VTVRFCPQAAISVPGTRPEASLGNGECIIGSGQWRQAVKTAGVAAGNVAVACTGFGRERAARTWALRVDRATRINSNGSPKSMAAARLATRAQHARSSIIDNFGEHPRHPTLRIGIKLATQKHYAIGRAAGATVGTGFAVTPHSDAPLCRRNRSKEEAIGSRRLATTSRGGCRHRITSCHLAERIATLNSRSWPCAAPTPPPRLPS
jgi:hypothetical protein